jgi:hypothetical protein
MLTGLAVLAAVIFAFGYGLFAGNAHGHHDAMQVIKTSEGRGEMTLKEFMTDPGLRAAVREQLTATYEDVPGMRAPDPDEVIEDALRTVRVVVGEHASDQVGCNKVDPCRAKALVLDRFQLWLENSAA